MKPTHPWRAFHPRPKPAPGTERRWDAGLDTRRVRAAGGLR